MTVLSSKIFTRSIAFIFVAGVILGIQSGNGFAQGKKKEKKKGEPTIGSGSYEVGVSASGVSSAGEPSIWIEPCGKETEEQVAELEKAPDIGAQLEILRSRLDGDSEWDRACSTVRAGKFGAAAAPLLPQVLRMLRDEKNGAVSAQLEKAVWMIPVPKGIPLDERIALTKDLNVYQRLFGTISLAQIRFPENSHEQKRIVESLIETTKDEDVTVRWAAVMVIRELGFDNVDVSSAISRLCEMIKGDKYNPIVPLRALVPIGPRAMSAGPLVFDILINPKNYVEDEKDDNIRSYSLHLTAAIVLGRMGEGLVPLLKEQVVAHPYHVIRVLSNLGGESSFDLLLELTANKDADIRKEAITSMPGVTSLGAKRLLPRLLVLVNDADQNVREAALSKIGSVGEFTKPRDADVKLLISKKVLPRLLAEARKGSCYASLAIGRFGNEARPILAQFAKLLKRKRNYCVQSALFKLGPEGQKYLTEEEITNLEKFDQFNYDLNDRKIKPVTPKVKKPVKKTTPTDG